jgi:hypothetical protein
MASFTDQAYQFNPYINTQPVEAMVKVGMLKQATYDENVQRIGAQLDSTASLPVVRDVDKQYLQQLINQSKDSLNKMGNADFSDRQLVDSVSGMIGKISKDPNVLAGVNSYQNIQKQAAYRQELEKAGKTSVSNDYDFDSAYSNYLNSTDLGRSFNHKYTPYTDVRKKASEAIKALMPNSIGFDIPFEEVDGKINTKKIADAMKRYNIKGVSESQIEMAIRSSLTPDDMNQLRLDANYQFKNYSPEDLVNIATSDYQNSKKEAAKQLEYLKGQKAVYVGNVQKQEAIDNDIAKYEQLLGKDGSKGLLDEKYENELYNAYTNPDAVKVSLYKEGFVKQFANAFKWQNQEEQLVKNPIREQMNEDRTYALSVQKFNRDILESDRDYQLKVEDFKLKAFEAANKNKADGNGEWVTVGNETVSTLEAVKNFNNYVTEKENQYEAERAKLKAGGFDDKTIDRLIAEYQADPIAASKSINPLAVPPIQRMLAARDELAGMKEKQITIRKEAEQKAGITNLSSELTKGKSNIIVNVNGENITLTPKEVFEIAQARGTSYPTNSSLDAATKGVAPGFVPTSPVVTYDRSKLSQKQRLVVDNLEKSRNALPSVEKEIFTYNTQIAEKQKLANQYYQEGIAPITSRFVPRVKGVFDKEGKIPPSVASNLNSLIVSGNIQAIAADGKYDVNKVNEYLSEKNVKDTDVSVMQAGDSYEVWITNKKEPKEIQKLRLSSNQVNSIFGAGYVEGNTSAQIRLDMGRGNTNLTGDPRKSLLKVSNGDFKNIKRLNVTADLNRDLDNPNVFLPYVNIKKKDGRWVNLPITGSDPTYRVGYEQGLSTLTSLTDENLIKLIKDSYPDFDISTLDYK